jgi:hypothetical protein
MGAATSILYLGKLGRRPVESVEEHKIGSPRHDASLLCSSSLRYSSPQVVRTQPPAHVLRPSASWVGDARRSSLDDQHLGLMPGASPQRTRQQRSRSVGNELDHKRDAVSQPIAPSAAHATSTMSMVLIPAASSVRVISPATRTLSKDSRRRRRLPDGDQRSSYTRNSALRGDTGCVPDKGSSPTHPSSSRSPRSSASTSPRSCTPTSPSTLSSNLPSPPVSTASSPSTPTSLSFDTPPANLGATHEKENTYEQKKQSSERAVAASTADEAKRDRKPKRSKSRRRSKSPTRARGTPARAKSPSRGKVRASESSPAYMQTGSGPARSAQPCAVPTGVTPPSTQAALAAPVAKQPRPKNASRWKTTRKRDEQLAQFSQQMSVTAAQSAAAGTVIGAVVDSPFARLLPLVREMVQSACPKGRWMEDEKWKSGERERDPLRVSTTRLVCCLCACGYHLLTCSTSPTGTKTFVHGAANVTLKMLRQTIRKKANFDVRVRSPAGRMAGEGVLF